jgi:hypothetical protein
MYDSYDMEGDDMYSGGSGGGGMYGYGGRTEVDPVEHKLMRFYDFVGFPNAPKPGRKYVYRLRYAVNDPNFPADPKQQPKISTLSPETTVRVLDLMSKAKETNERSYQRWTEWSEPCAPVSLPSNESLFVGKVEPGSTSDWTIGQKTVTVPRDSPKATIVASQYNFEYGTRIPMRLDVREGAVLSHKAESVDVIDPITKEIKKLPDAELKSMATIVDLDGGNELAIAEELPAPGVILMSDSQGNLQVNDDISDQEYYRIYSFADERGE